MSTQTLSLPLIVFRQREKEGRGTGRPTLLPFHSSGDSASTSYDTSRLSNSGSSSGTTEESSTTSERLKILTVSRSEKSRVPFFRPPAPLMYFARSNRWLVRVLES